MKKINDVCKKSTETYVKLSDVHKEFGEWCKLYSNDLKSIGDIEKKTFHYFVNLLPSIEFSENE